MDFKIFQGRIARQPIQVSDLTFILIAVFCLLFNFSRGQVLDYATRIDVDPPRLTTEYYHLVQVNSRDMVELGDVSIAYQQGDKVEILEAVILGANGKVIRSVEKKEIKTRNYFMEGAFFVDYMIQEFQLKWNQYPYRVRCRYRITQSKFIYVARWFPGVDAGVLTERASLTVRYPANFRFRVHQPSNVSSDSTVTKNRVERRWTFTSVGPFKSEKLALPVNDLMPLVIIAPLEFSYGVPGSLASWGSYGEWLRLLNAGTSDLPPYEKQKVGAIVAKTADKREQIRQLYHYLQDNTRYINVSMDVGGLKSYPSSYVSTRKYGDCKALTTFMQSLLEAAGIPSFCADVNGADNPNQILSKIPGPQFNHVILCVPLEKDTLWLENTANYLPAGYLGTFTQNRTALFWGPGGSRLVKTPALTPEQVKCVRRTEYLVRFDSVSRATARWVLRGDDFEHFKGRLLNWKEADVRNDIENYLPNRDHRLVRWSHHQENRDSPEITLVLELEAANLVRTLGSIRAIRPPASDFPELEVPGARKTPVRINYPVLEEETLIYRLPETEKVVIELPTPIQVNTTFGTYAVQSRTDGSVVTVQRTYSLSDGFIPLDRYPEFYKFMSAIREADRNFTILLKPKS